MKENVMSCNILLVEDDDVAAEAIQRSMRKAQIPLPLVVAEDGKVALDILRGKHPDKKIETPVIVLLDINMPRMNGFEFLDALRADPKLKPTVVFMLTTSSSDSDRAKAYNSNIAGYMVKDAVGEHFKQLFKLLESYCSTVLLPA
jgi:CheY-like chemotaxis protein